MSEEEKETIEDCKELVQELKQHKDKDFIGRLYYKNKPVEDILSVLLNLIEKQQKELNNIKEIEKSHQEENGKLKIELGKEKEKNTELRIKISARETVVEELKKELEQEKEKNKELKKYEEAYKLLSYGLNNYISKDKLKFILSKLNISDIEPWSTYKIDGQILFDLQELLEEK